MCTLSVIVQWFFSFFSAQLRRESRSACLLEKFQTCGLKKRWGHVRNEFDLHSHCLLLKWRVTQNLLIYWLFETSYCVLYKGCVWGLKARCSGAKYTCIFLSGIETSEQKRNCKGFFTGSKACSSMQYCFLSAQRNVFTEQGSAWLETWVQLYTVLC